LLEDNDRRLQRRLRQTRLKDLPERVTLLTEWPTLDDNCLEEIEAWIAEAENPRLVRGRCLREGEGHEDRKETDYDFELSASSNAPIDREPSQRCCRRGAP
jgi:hypothetical protein